MSFEKMRLRKNQKGYSLAEVIVAVAVLGLLSALFSEIVFTALKARDSSRERLEALSVATSAIDEIKSYRGNTDNSPNQWNSVEYLKHEFLSPDATTAGFLGYIRDLSNDPTGNTFTKEVTDTNNITYQITIEIDPDNNGSNIPGLFDITVTVSSPNAPSVSAVTRIRGSE